MSERPPAGRILLVGGSGGLVGGAIRREFSKDWAIRSVHRHPSPMEERSDTEWIDADVAAVADWAPLLNDVDVVVNVAWLRAGSRRKFVPLKDGLLRLIHASEAAGVARFVHLSVPDAPDELERTLPYLYCKREVDRALRAASMPYLLLRPTMLFGPGDKLVTVMMRTMDRYHRFPMFGDGEYHVSPLAASDLAAILRFELGRPGSRELVLGGPERLRYRELTDRMWAALRAPPRYWSMSPRTSVWLAATLERLGSHLLYAYEVKWLLSDMLGVPPYMGWDRPLTPVTAFVERQARLLDRPIPHG